jgi:hypothetical protein
MGKTKDMNIIYGIRGKSVIMDSCEYQMDLPCGMNVKCMVKVFDIKIRLHKKVCKMCSGVKIKMDIPSK